MGVGFLGALTNCPRPVTGNSHDELDKTQENLKLEKN